VTVVGITHSDYTLAQTDRQNWYTGAGWVRDKE